MGNEREQQVADALSQESGTEIGADQIVQKGRVRRILDNVKSNPRDLLLLMMAPMVLQIYYVTHPGSELHASLSTLFGTGIMVIAVFQITNSWGDSDD